MTPRELFNKLENTGNHYSYFKKDKSFVKFSTGGWSENEELVTELETEFVWNILIIKWERGGHYTFEIPDDLDFDYPKEGWRAKIKKQNI